MAAYILLFINFSFSLYYLFFFKDELKSLPRNLSLLFWSFVSLSWIVNVLLCNVYPDISIPVTLFNIAIQVTALPNRETIKCIILS
mgnify:CR=1 FL=1